MTQGKLESSLRWLLLAIVCHLTFAADGMAGSISALYTFHGNISSQNDGYDPMAGLVSDSSGNLYGTNWFGGDVACYSGRGPDYGCGTVFELKRTKNGWREETLHAFLGGSDGALPFAGLTIDHEGRLYGTTMVGGSKGCRGYGCGTVFKLTRTSSGSWQETVLHSFHKYGEGQNPYAALTLDARGNLYGTTFGGGLYSGGCDVGCGVVFQLAPDRAGKWKERVLYRLTSNGNPIGGVVFDAAGSLYGATGGCDGCGNGEVFMLKPSKGTWIPTILYYFPGGSAGFGSDASLVLDKSGNLYGTTPFGGGCNGLGCGAVFELTQTSGGQWNENILHAFAGGIDGVQPEGSLIFGSDGSLYGTTVWGGGSLVCQLGCGTVFKLTSSGSGWSETLLYGFPGGRDGYAPYSGVILDTYGNIYGTAAGGGEFYSGLVYEITP